jgi:hypothetical protein
MVLRDPTPEPESEIVALDPAPEPEPVIVAPAVVSPPQPVLEPAEEPESVIVVPAPAAEPKGMLVVPPPAAQPEPIPTPVFVTEPAPAPPRPYVTTKLGGRMSVWFPDANENLVRMWAGGIHPQTIARVLGRGITEKAVQTHASRMRLPSRAGLPLSKDVEVARQIVEDAAPLPDYLSNRHGKRMKRRTCGWNGTMFFGGSNEHISQRAKETRAWQNAQSTAWS